MSTVMAVVLSVLLLTVTGCAISSNPSAAKQETDKKDVSKKSSKEDQGKMMNEESLNAIR